MYANRKFKWPGIRKSLQLLQARIFHRGIINFVQLLAAVGFNFHFQFRVFLHATFFVDLAYIKTKAVNT